jgi:hypothetical protein
MVSGLGGDGEILEMRHDGDDSDEAMHPKP